MRINRYLALAGYATRKGADELISQGLVRINGKVATLGDKVADGDEVEIRNTKKPKALVYFAYNKPVGVVTHSPQDAEQSIQQVLGRSDVFPIGRLDKQSHGLIILTNDGRVTDRLLHPSHEHDKEYRIHTKMKLRDSFEKNMERGVTIEGYVTKPTKVVRHGDFSFSITLQEGKRHQIRRMVVALHNEVADLKRVRVMNIKLGPLKSGGIRTIEGKELQEFLSLLNLPN